jgi:hypothetical protein
MKVKTLLLSDFNTLIFSTDFEKSQMQSLIELHPLAAELFHADGRTDRHGEANSRFLKRCEHAYKCIL